MTSTDLHSNQSQEAADRAASWHTVSFADKGDIPPSVATQAQDRARKESHSRGEG